jgi:two-component system NtrC family sensor kinase
MPSEKPKERILVVDQNPETLELIAHQTLRPMGYQVKIAQLASSAIQHAISFAPHLILANLDLPDLSGKDLLVALSSQGLDIPVLLIADKGKEEDILQAFRLGAADFIHPPLREAEVLAAVERALKSVRQRVEKEQLARQLQQTNQQLQQRVRELTTIFAMGKAVTSITNQRDLFRTIVNGAVRISEADRGWLLIRDENPKTFILRAEANLPALLRSRLNQPFDDGLSSLVALSGETLTIHGTPLKRFKISQLGQAALVVPVRAQKEVIGLMVMTRKASQPFSKATQTILEAVADYAAISIVNARLFQALEERAARLAEALKATEKSPDQPA